jgi:hypothetical protein
MGFTAFNPSYESRYEPRAIPRSAHGCGRAGTETGVQLRRPDDMHSPVLQITEFPAHSLSFKSPLP